MILNGDQFEKRHDTIVSAFSGADLESLLPSDLNIRLGEIALVINTPLGRASHYDEQAIRRAALQFNVPCVTTMTGAQAIVEAISARAQTDVSVVSLQELHAQATHAG